MEADYEEEPPSKLRKFYLMGVAFFLIFVLILGTEFGWHLVSLVGGRLVSVELINNSFTIKDQYVVKMDPLVITALQQLDRDNINEIKVCLTGYKENNTYVVEGMYIPVIYAQTVHSVTSRMCNSETIISLHSHPRFRCLFSDQDLKMYQRFSQVNPDGMIGLICDENRFTFYGFG